VTAAGLRATLPGLAASAALATAAYALAELPLLRDTLHVGVLLVVVLLGMALAPLVARWGGLTPGLRAAQRPVLRWAVAGLGFRLSLGELLRIGRPALVVVTLATFGALLFSAWLARRLGVREKLGLLLGVGGAICGASAVVAADSVLQGEKEDSTIALGLITLLGTLGIVLYPWLGRALHMSTFRFAVWDGASLHEMAQVVAAGAGYGKDAVAIATVVKLVRICLLAPVVFGLAWWRRSRGGAGEAKVAPVPWFLVVFVVFTALNSSALLPAPWLAAARNGDLWLLAVGMAGVGVQTRFTDLAAAGTRPIVLGVVQWLFLAAAAYGLTLALVR